MDFKTIDPSATQDADAVDLRVENAALRSRVAELERALAERSAAPSSEGSLTSTNTATAAAAMQSPHEWLRAPTRALVQWRPDGAVTRWSEGAERLLGWSAGEAIGRTLADLVSADPVTTEQIRAFTSDSADGRSETAQSLVKTKDGRPLTSLWTFAVLHDPEGNPRQIVAEVEDTGDHARADWALRESHRMLVTVLDNSPALIWVRDLECRYMLVNRSLTKAVRMHPLEFIGRTDIELGFANQEVSDIWLKDARSVVAGGRPVQVEEVLQLEQTVYFLTIKFPIQDARGEPIGICGVCTDITTLKRAEAERAALQQQVIAAQQASLRELSTPLIPLADKVLAMPLVGAIDRARVEQIMEALLHGISKQRAHTAILDITGVRVVDAEVTEALVRTARAARLLGARVVLTGIRPEVAQALVNLGTDLGDLVTRSTLQSGIAYALEK